MYARTPSAGIHRGFLIVTALLLSASSATAHNLEAEARTKVVRKVQVESWFSSGKTPKQAKVEVFKTDGQLLTQGKLDGEGKFVFFAERQPLRVVVSAGEGHLKELNIEAENTEIDTTEQLASADRSSPISIRDILAGISFLLGAAAFVMSWRNTMRLNKQPR